MLRYVKSYFAHIEGAWMYQTFALLLFMSIFIYAAWSTFSKPNEYYEELENLPLDEDNNIER